MDPKQLRILLVDDDNGFREMIQVWLGSRYEVQAASNVRQAMEMLEGFEELEKMTDLTDAIGITSGAVFGRIAGRNAAGEKG